MGELDLLKPLLERMGKVHFGRVLMKPGKPFTFATVSNGHDGEKRRDVLVFATPGNPVSSLVTFLVFAVPALRTMAGWPCPDWPILSCKVHSFVHHFVNPSIECIVRSFPELSSWIRFEQSSAELIFGGTAPVMSL